MRTITNKDLKEYKAVNENQTNVVHIKCYPNMSMVKANW